MIPHPQVFGTPPPYNKERKIGGRGRSYFYDVDITMRPTTQGPTH